MRPAVSENPAERMINLKQHRSHTGSLHNLKWERGMEGASRARGLAIAVWIVAAQMILVGLGAKRRKWKRASVRFFQVRCVGHLPHAVKIWKPIAWRRGVGRKRESGVVAGLS